MVLLMPENYINFLNDAIEDNILNKNIFYLPTLALHKTLSVLSLLKLKNLEFKFCPPYALNSTL